MDNNSQPTDASVATQSTMAPSDDSKASQSTFVKEIGENVLKAIHELREKNGCRLRDIKKFLNQKYGIDVERNLPQVKFFLNKFQKDGRIIKDADGKYKDAAGKRRRKRSKMPSSGKKRKSSGGKKSKARRKSKGRRSPARKGKRSPAKGKRRKRSRKAAAADQST